MAKLLVGGVIGLKSGDFFHLDNKYHPGVKTAFTGIFLTTQKSYNNFQIFLAKSQPTVKSKSKLLEKKGLVTLNSEKRCYARAW